MQENPQYVDITKDVIDFLQQRIDVCIAAGIKKENIILDPGFGFGKTIEHNLQLMHDLSLLSDIGFPVLVGVSRKSMIGAVLDKKVDDRLIGGIALAVMAMERGAKIIRTHDVEATMDAVKLYQAVNN